MNLLVEILFPRRCPICDKPVDKMGRYICTKCRPKIKYIKEPFCMKCGKGLRDDTLEYCEDCKNSDHIFTRGRALYEYDTVKEAIYRLKYDDRMEYADFFGKDLAKKLGKEVQSWKADAIIPVPLHKDREKQRGYNQANLLAKALGRELDIPVKENFILRSRGTLAQKKLNVKERQNNLKNAFKIGQNDVKLKTVIVVDDIYTTGATMDAVARCLKLAGVREVYFVSLAVGRGI